MKIEKIFKKLILFILLITLCAAGLPAQKAQADEEPLQAAEAQELEAPVITALKNTASGIKVCWDEVDGADYYCVYRKASFESQWTRVSKRTATSYHDKNADEINGTLTKGTTVAYKIRAVSVDGNKTVTATSKAKAIIRVLGPEWYDIKMKRKTNGLRLELDYDCDRYGAQGIIVYRKAPGESAFTRIAKVKGSTYTDKDFEENQVYYYKLCVYNSGSKSAVNSKARPYKLLSAPEPEGARNEDGYAVLSWEAVPGANGYMVYRSETGESGTFENVYDMIYDNYYVYTRKQSSAYYVVKAYYHYRNYEYGFQTGIFYSPMSTKVWVE